MTNFSLPCSISVNVLRSEEQIPRGGAGILRNQYLGKVVVHEWVWQLVSSQRCRHKGRFLLSCCSPKCCPISKGQVSRHPIHTGDLCVAKGSWGGWCWSQKSPWRADCSGRSSQPQTETERQLQGFRLGWSSATICWLQGSFFFVLTHIL